MQHYKKKTFRESPDGLLSDPLTVVPGVVCAVEVRHVGRGPVRRAVPGIVGHTSGLGEIGLSFNTSVSIRN